MIDLLYGEVERMTPPEKDDYHSPVCGAVNPARGFYRQGMLIGCEDCITIRDADFVPEFKEEN